MKIDNTLSELLHWAQEKRETARLEMIGAHNAWNRPLYNEKHTESLAFSDMIRKIKELQSQNNTSGN